MSGQYESYSIRGPNTQGLPSLPDELLLEILSHLPAPFPLSVASYVDINPATHMERRNALGALSVTCRNLRRFFRPYFWQRLEIRSGLRVGDHSHVLIEDSEKRKDKKSLAKELLRQLKIVTDYDPRLIDCVQVLNIEITEFAIRQVFAELGRCFALLSNLHTVRIQSRLPGPVTEETAEKMAKRSFKKYGSYPQIKTAVLSAPYTFLGFCPNLESFHCIDTYNNPFQFIDEMGTFSTLQKLSGPFDIIQIRDMKDSLPSLIELSVLIPAFLIEAPTMVDLAAAVGMLLESFPKLQVLVIHNAFKSPWSDFIYKVKFVFAVLRVVRGLKDVKQVIVREEHDSPGFHITDEDVPLYGS